MWQQILKALRGGDVLGEMIEQLGQMLDAGQWMFDQAADVLTRTVDWPGVAGELYARDQEINRIEQGLRERIVTHLAVGNQNDLPACLVLMSVVKDAERIGDYCKNIFEVGKFYEREYAHPHYARPLRDVRLAVGPLFELARDAFVAADTPCARKVLDKAGGLMRTCDVLIQQLLSTSEQIPADEAVCYVLLARFYKRVAAHLGNIASSVLSPVSMIDYRPVGRTGGR